mgnify:FL=1
MYRYVKLRSKVYFCKKEQNSTLIDCNRLKIYHLNKEDTKYLNFLLKGFAVNTKYISDKETLDFIEFLVEKKLIKFTKEYQVSQFVPTIHWTKGCKDCEFRYVCYDERKTEIF